MGRASIIAAFVGGVLAASISVLIASTPFGVIPPFVPKDSPFRRLPPYLIFRPIMAANEFFHRMVKLTTPPNVQVLNMATSYWQSEVLFVLTKNRIFDALDESSDRTCQDVAYFLELQPHATCEYMRAGAKLGLLTVDTNGKYTLGPTGVWCTENHPFSLQNFVRFAGSDESYLAWRAAGSKTIRSGRSGFYEAHRAEFWEYNQKHPEIAATFDRAMQDMSFGTMGAILGDWAPHAPKGTFCDIGGGIGTATALVLEHYPEMNGIVFDQPVTTKRGRKYMESRGLDHRVRFTSGSFFDALPTELEECDYFFLKYILHDWDDKDSLTILKNVQERAKPGSKLMIAENIQEVGKGRSLEATQALFSVNMLAALPYGAKDRTLQQHKELMRKIGIDDTKAELILTRDIVSVVQVDLRPVAKKIA